jgi:NAD(P)H-flavin reductase
MSIAAANAHCTMPELQRVAARRRELADTWTLEIDPAKPFAFAPGQFNMLYVHGIGEVPISISGDPAQENRLVHTVRSVGRTTEALCALDPGDSIGVRGPYGKGWPLAAAEGGDLMIVAGGIGLAPLRPAVYDALARRERYGRIVLLYGGRTPELLLYAEELEQWRARGTMDVALTVDSADKTWRGHVGVVTALIARADLVPERTTVLLCGPEVMMRFCVAELLRHGVAREHIHVSLERNMQCAVGLCGRCQLGPYFVCRDGAVLPYGRVERLLRVREL